MRIVTSETLTADPFVSGLYFGECPRWHDGRLWYSDFFDHAVISVSSDGERRVEVDFDGEPAGLGWLPDGRLLFNSRLDRIILRREQDGMLVEHGDLKPWATWHANDMVVASNGQAYSGNFGFDLDGLYDGSVESSAIAPASLVRVDPDGSSHEAAADLQFPNGAVITEDGGMLIIAESFGGRLSAFDRAPDGTLTNRRVWAALEGIAPDGICLCADGSVWVANALGSGVRARGRGRTCPRACGDVHELLRLHVGRRRPAHALHGHRARQQRSGGASEAQRSAREGSDDRARNRPPLMPVGDPSQGGGGTGRWPRGKNRTGSLARAAVWAVTATAAAAAVLIGVWSGPPAGAAAAPPYLLALGGSASVGFQPTAAHPRGQPTTSGYAEDLVPLEQKRWPGLTVVHLGNAPVAGASSATPEWSARAMVWDLAPPASIQPVSAA